MKAPTPLKPLTILAAAAFLAACAQPVPATATATPEPSHTPTATFTPTPTPTPTPTAPPLQISGNLRAGLLATPASQRGAPCGMVDILDFPLGPPDGLGYRGQWSFGRHSDRYNGIHAGEDWGHNSGGSLGEPVYSIGHGTVTYAQPLGWGVDRGVVIVRHVFPDGSTFLSFYGHLDPPSVALRAGDCVARGDSVGAIGKPRGRPHLHFEIRTHMPDEPGPGYWPVDPRLAGWKVPSSTIWDYRTQISPGVAWTRPLTANLSAGIGLMSDGTLAALNDRQVVGIDPRDGAVRWSRPLSMTLSGAILDATGAALYFAGLGGSLQAIDTLGAQAWQIDAGAWSKVTLMPLPGGGVVAHANRQLIGISASGRRLWQIDLAAAPLAWTLSGDRLVFTAQADQPAVYSLDRSGRLDSLAPIDGRPLIAGDWIFIYRPTGVYRLEPETGSARLIYPLDSAGFGAGDIAALPGGRLLVSHRGRTDQRLILIDADGALRWDRSVADLGASPPRLLVMGERAYALTENGTVLSIDPVTGDARRVFDGGGPPYLAGDVWAFATADGRLLFDYRSGAIIALDPQTAFEAAGGIR